MTATTTLLLLIAAVALLLSQAASLTCTSQTFSRSAAAKFANCADLPTLKSYLHWTYDPAAKPDPTLSVAFIAPPASPDGWVAWALNPTATGMVGSQALIAFKDAKGSAAVKTYNISSYGPLVADSPISYGVLKMSAEYSDGVMRIFATLSLPAGGLDQVNQVWQVGATVTDGVPVKHAFLPDNLGSKSTLQLVTKAAAPGKAPAAGKAPAKAPTPASGAPTGRQSGNEKGGSSLGKRGSLGLLHGVLVVLGVSIFGF